MTLGVEDLSRSRRFYTEALGWPASPAGGDEVCFLRLEGLVLALFPRTSLAADAGVPAERSGFRGVSLSHNVAEEADVDRLTDEVRAAGATIVREPAKADWGGRIAYFTDPDGFLWEIAWNPHFPFGDDGTIQLP